MGIYRGTAPLKAYKGDMQPVNVYKGSTKVAGWHSASYSGTSPLTVDCDYNVPPDALTVDGKCVQTGTPSPDSPAPISTITGDVTITGADGAASDTVTVALGSNVCASLPDGTHDSYDAVTGVLTKWVGRYAGASETSWTIADAESNSSILSDCFGADVLDGTSYSAYDAVCQPNLTPFFANSLTDTSYWTSFFDTNHVTQLTDGWAHVACDNSSGTVTSFVGCSPKPLSALTAETRYTVLAEIRNNTSAKLSAESFVKILQNESTGVINQLETQHEIRDAIANGSQRFSVTTKSDMSAATTLNNSVIRVAAGDNVSFDLRLSLYEGDYDGAYKPYALPCAPTVYYKLATPTTVQLTPHLPVVRTGIKALSIGADVAPTLSATVKSMD
jgi:hypothetical protein